MTNFEIVLISIAGAVNIFSFVTLYVVIYEEKAVQLIDNLKMKS